MENKKIKPVTATEIKKRMEYAFNHPSEFPEIKYVHDRLEVMRNAIFTPLFKKTIEILKRNGRL